MKTLLIAVFLFFALTASANTPPVYQENAIANNGVSVIRLVNTTPYAVSCWLRDEYTFTSFVVPGQRVSLWYPIYGYYEWYCE
jgi:hypothetical protein